MPIDGDSRFFNAEESFADLTEASAAVTASANVTADPLAGAGFLTMTYDVTAVSGTSPTLDVSVEASTDGGTTWFEVVALTQITTTTTARVGCFIAGDKYRIKQTVGGTSPSFTRTITCSIQRV